MTIHSAGYAGTVTEPSWSGFQSQTTGLADVLGGPPGVLSRNDWAVSILTGGADRAVRVAPGMGFGHGIVDYNDANVDSLALTAPSGTANRWDTVVCRRNWSTNTTTFAVVAGTATKAIATLTNNSPGTGTWDWPIALARATGGQAQVQELQDLRARPGKVLYVPDALALPTPTLGQVALLNGELQQGIWNGSALVWQSVAAPPWSNVTLVTGITAYLQAPQYRVVGGIIEFRGIMQRPAAAFPSTGSLFVGDIPDAVAGDTSRYWSSSQNGHPYNIQLQPDGNLVVFFYEAGVSYIHLDGMRVSQ